MASTLQEAYEAMKPVERLKTGKKKNIADRLLGKFKSVTPKGKTSTQYLRELRGTLYGKSFPK